MTQLVCHACAERDHRVKQFTEGGGETAGMAFVVRLQRPGEE